MISLNLDRVRVGAITGFIVVIVTTILNLLGRSIDLLPEPMDLRNMAELFFDPVINPTGALIAGIIVHIIGGVMVGIVYVYFIRSVGVGSGILFMLTFWLIMMLTGMPLAGRGWFGLNYGIIMPIATFVLNLIFGFCMGFTAKKLLNDPSSMAN